MAQKPIRLCTHPGCGVLTREGYCPKHKPKDRDRRSEEVSAWHLWYGLPIWKYTLRPQQLIREPFCRECTRQGLRVRATDVDHIRPHRGSWALFIDPKNHQSLCHACHSRKTAAEMRQLSAEKRR